MVIQSARPKYDLRTALSEQGAPSPHQFRYLRP